jgi:hypothetical protein
MKKLILTGQHLEKKKFPTFVVYNLYTGKILNKCEYVDVLDNLELKDSGRPTFRPFGISIDQNDCYIVSNDRCAIFDLHSWQLLKTLQIPLLVNTHQILKHGTNIYVTNTANDSIGVHDIITNYSFFYTFPEYTVSRELIFVKDALTLDKLHINSLCMEKNYLYFCLHNKGKRPSDFFKINLENHILEKIISLGFCCHNIVIFKKTMYTLSTKQVIYALLI